MASASKFTRHPESVSITAHSSELGRHYFAVFPYPRSRSRPELMPHMSSAEQNGPLGSVHQNSSTPNLPAGRYPQGPPELVPRLLSGLFGFGSWCCCCWGCSSRWYRPYVEKIRLMTLQGAAFGPPQLWASILAFSGLSVRMIAMSLGICADVLHC